MLPIIDYGGIAIVISQVTAIGGTFSEDGIHGFEVYLTGKEDPIIINFDSAEKSKESRNELLAVIAQYYYIQQYGPDFDIDDMEEFKEEDDGEIDKEKH